MAYDDSVTVSFRLSFNKEEDKEILRFFSSETMKICYGDKSKFIKSALIRAVQDIKRNEHDNRLICEMNTQRTVIQETMTGEADRVINAIKLIVRDEMERITGLQISQEKQAASKITEPIAEESVEAAPCFVKVPGMKRFKRLDTISGDFSRNNLEAMFKYGDASQAAPVNHTLPLIPIRKTILTPYQRKCYARMYRLRLAEKKRFTYKSAYLYEQIRKMHELQEEYLVVVKYDVKSFVELVHLKFCLERVDEKLCKVQKEIYRDRASQKRSCKTAEDMAFFEASVDDYWKRLKQIKLQKKDNLKELKAVERCLERDGSTLDAELEYWISVDDMVELAEIEKDEVPENPYYQTEDLVISQVISEDITDEIAADVEDRDAADMKLPANKADYMRMSVAEKVFCYPFDAKGIESAFEMVRAYFEKIDMDTGFHSVYEEAKLLSDYYEKQKAEEFIGERAERVIETMKLLGIDAGRMAEYSIDVLSEVFSFGDMEYFAGIKLFNRVIDRLEINMEQQKRYEVFDRIYTESMQEKKDKRDRCRR